MQTETAQIDLEKCTLCGSCLEACGFDAIEMQAAPKADSSKLAEYQGVWVLAEQVENQLAPVTFELLGQARELAKVRQCKVSVVLYGSDVQTSAQKLIDHGADQVLMAQAPELEAFNDEVIARLLIKLIENDKPEIVLFPATTAGRSVGSRIAIIIDAGLTADCTALDIDPDTGNLLQTRPTFGGNIMAVIECPAHRPQMASVRPNVMPPAEPVDGHTGEIITVELMPDELQSRTKRIKYVPESGNAVNIVEASALVSGGRGLQGPANFKIIEELADTLKAGVAASRAAVDSNWIGYAHQVGQTGKTVCPKLYFACGISGQIQHLAGMTSAENIVAINKDPDAPIFDIATFGIVGDVLEIVPAITAECRKLLNR